MQAFTWIIALATVVLQITAPSLAAPTSTSTSALGARTTTSTTTTSSTSTTTTMTRTSSSSTTTAAGNPCFGTGGGFTIKATNPNGTSHNLYADTSGRYHIIWDESGAGATFYLLQGNTIATEPSGQNLLYAQRPNDYGLFIEAPMVASPYKDRLVAVNIPSYDCSVNLAINGTAQSVVYDATTDFVYVDSGNWPPHYLTISLSAVPKN